MIANPQTQTARTEAGARFSDRQLKAWNDALATVDAADVLAWAVAQFGERVVVASSFGAEDVVLIDLIARHAPEARVFTIDTGRLPQATYDVMEALRDRYGLRVEVFVPEPVSLMQLLTEHGPNSMYRSVEDRRACCHVRKVEPLRRALATADAWVTGLRREQTETRTGVSVVGRDALNGDRIKINPLAAWTHDDVWAYIRQHRVPYNRLHDEGYRSIGCAPCTRAVRDGEPERAGRWWWESPDKKECGLHR